MEMRWEILGRLRELPLVKFTSLFNTVGLWDGWLIIGDVVIGFIPIYEKQSALVKLSSLPQQ